MYREYFGFDVLPFADKADPPAIYLNPVYEEALATLRYGFQAGKGAIVFTGEAGTGKTTLIRKFLADLGSAVRPIFIDKTAFSLADSLRAALGGAGVITRGADDAALIESFQTFLTRSSQEGATACVIMDEAQAWESETLEGFRQLLNSGENQSKPLQLIFIGQPELIDKLDEPQLAPLKRRVALNCRLLPLTRSEVSRYIDFQLRSAGYQNTPLFDQAAIGRIAQHSHGIPRLVNKICDNALLAAYRDSRRQIGQDHIDEVIRELRLVKPEPVRQTAKNDDMADIDREQLSSDWRSKRAAPEWQFDHGSTPPAEIPPPLKRLKPTRRVIEMIGVALVLLITVGVVMYAGTAQSYLERVKAQGEAVLSKIGRLTSSTKSEKATRSRGRATPADDETLAEDNHATVGAPSREQILQAVKVSNSPPASVAPTLRENRQSVESDAETRLIELEVHQAIANRAIEGVSVKLLEEGTVILDGEVASTRQKALAERAALGVEEVARVRNQIRIRR